MGRKSISRICMAVLLSMSGLTQAAVFSDDFDAVHDYLVDGVEGTGWDGFLGSGAGETVNALNASTDRPGALYIESANSFWEGAFSPLGPFLYKVVEGDFVATVQVTDFPGPGSVSARTEHADSFLMARVANLDDAGPGEDFVSVHYFPTWSANIRRSIDNGTEDEGPGTGDGYNCARYIQLERVGNTFYFRRSFDGVTWTEVPSSPVTRDDLDGLALQVGLAHCMYSANTGYVAFDDFIVSGPGVVPSNKAYNPRPAGGSTDVPRDVELSWTPFEEAIAHDLYLGTVLADVTAADRANPLGLALGTGQDANSYDVGRLEFGQTYYWRVDEVQADGVTIDVGDVWTFTVEPYAYPIENITATASSSNNANMGPEKTIDGSGLNDAGEHSTDGKAMWLSNRNGPQPTWIQYTFDRSHKLHEMLVWNSNQVLEPGLGLGAKDVTVEYSLDGDNWTALGDFEFAQAPGEDTCTADTTVDFGGVMAQHVKLTIQNNWGGILVQYGLSEVRFFSIPVSAREPSPADGETGVNPQVTLNWRPGREAASHEVYLSTDEQAVIDGTALEATISEPSYETALDLTETYYWKVVEVNEVEDPAAWAGDVWSFSTSDYLVVDDFESYTDDIEAGQTIWQAWSDGLEDPQNGGSQVGYGEAPFAERTIVHSGRQSMPLAYDNSTSTFSQAVRTFDVSQDWTKHGITALVLFFHGRLDNASAPLYVKINNTKVPHSGSAATTIPLWKQWNIDLASLSTNLESVSSITVGVGNGASSGTGTLYIDDIRLYGTPPEVVAPTDPGNDGLVVQYSMEGNLQDGSGNGNHGTPMGEPSYADGPAGYGKVLNLDGTNDYVELPVGSLVSSLTSATFSTRVNLVDPSRAWQRIFDFGTGTMTYMFLSPNSGGTGVARFAITTSGGGGESIVSAPATLVGNWHHLAVTIDGASRTIQLYVDGAVVAEGPTQPLPADLGVTTQNWIGRSQYEGDAYFMGMLDEFRIYNRALSAGEVRYLAGDR